MMIFADKLIQLRKKAGWSQEELAEQMDVTRQSVSKWESAQSIPDLEKIIHLSKLFKVSTDYLLKEEIEDIGYDSKTHTTKHVSMEEAAAFLSIKNKTATSIAVAVFLCILSPICLLILGAVSEVPAYGVTEEAAGGIGMVVLLILVTIALAIFLSSGRKTAAFDYLEKDIFETGYGVYEMVEEQKARYDKTYTRSNILGAGLCIMALTPLFIGAALNDKNELLLMSMLSISFVFAGIGAGFFIRSGIVWASYEKLLQEGEYSKANKENCSITTAISFAYWLLATAIYLGYSLLTNHWGYSWVIWVVAGILYPALIVLIHSFSKQTR